MNLIQIYDELLQNHNDEYYLSLAKNEILLIPVLIEITQSGSYSERMKSNGILEKISTDYAEGIAPFAKYIIKAIDSHNDLAGWCLWRLITKVLEVNPTIWPLAESSFLSAMSTDDIGLFSIVCDCAPKIVQLCPKSRSSIENCLNDSAKREFKLNGLVSEICGKIASEKAKAALDIIGGIIC